MKLTRASTRSSVKLSGTATSLYPTSHIHATRSPVTEIVAAAQTGKGTTVMEIDWKRRGENAYLRIQNEIISILNTYVRPKGSRRIKPATVADNDDSAASLKRLLDFSQKLQFESDGRLSVPQFCYGRDRILEPSSDVLSELNNLIRPAFHYGWECKKCGRGVSYGSRVCPSCNASRDDQVTKEDRVNWNKEYVEPLSKHICEVQQWFDEWTKRRRNGKWNDFYEFSEKLRQDPNITDEQIAKRYRQHNPSARKYSVEELVKALRNTRHYRKRRDTQMG